MVIIRAATTAHAPRAQPKYAEKGRGSHKILEFGGNVQFTGEVGI